MKTIHPGQLVYWRNSPQTVLEIRGLSEAIVRSIDNQVSEVVPIAELTMGPQSEKLLRAPHILANDQDWDTAIERYDIIKPLLEMHNRQASDVEAVARAANKSLTTIYRWINRFEEQGLVSSLMRSGRSDKGNLRIGKEVEEVIQLKIDEYFLQEVRPAVSKLCWQVELECRKLDIDIPHKNTVYARVKRIEKEKLLAKRYSPKIAKNRAVPLRGKFPGADYPNAVVQIDHSPFDLIVVDSKHRLPIGRPYLTLALEVCSKMVSGFYLSLDSPSASSAGLCIAHAVARKEIWLAKRGIHAEWPIFGKMQKIHLDNAKEFRGTMLKRACQQHGIIHEWRPGKTPNYGPHVERAFRTFMAEAHSIEGTTFSNTLQKLEYDSEGRACMTLEELELWFTYFLVYFYHHRSHRGICDIPPIKLYSQFVHGTLETPGIGLPAPIEDEETFKLDFTPYVMRTVQREGILIDNVWYYAPTLGRWIEAVEPGTRKESRKFVVVRDPRDISVVYFLDPDTKTYDPIPYRNNTRPAISLWELRAVTKMIKDDPLNEVNEEMIFKGIEKMREIEKQAIEKTRFAKTQRSAEKRKRRMSERRLGWGNVHKKPEANASNELVDTTEVVNEIEPFADIEVGFIND